MKSLYIFCLTSMICFPGCKKFMEIDPPKDQIVIEAAFQDDGAASATIRGIYSTMVNSGFTSGYSLSGSFFMALSSDDLQYNGASFYFREIYQNSMTPASDNVHAYCWKALYQLIYYANSMLEGIAASSGMSENMKKQLTGEAKFVRAFSYFYLVNLYGDVPLVLTTDFKTNQLIARTPANDIYALIVGDLLAAKEQLPEDYKISGNERTRPNKWAATAFLARAYLYKKEWQKAAAEASLLIDNKQLFGLPADPDMVFLKESREAVWQLKPLSEGANTNDAGTYIITSDNPESSLTEDLVDAFETGDRRRSKWVGTYISTDGLETHYYAYKYKMRYATVTTEYPMMMRLAEQYLIRAEARAQLEDPAGAKADVDTIRFRAGLGATPANGKAAILLAIEQERRSELFMEWGHRWLDLKRTGRANAVLGVFKAPNWQPTDVLYPIFKPEIDINRLLIQNEGYK